MCFFEENKFQQYISKFLDIIRRTPDTPWYTQFFLSQLFFC